MALVRWDPWHEMLGAQREAYDLVRRMFGDWVAPGALRGFNGGTNFAPAVEAFTRGADPVVRAELPGIDPEKDVDISLQDNMLTIRGERRQDDQEKGDHYFRSETRYGSFERQLMIPEGTKAADISASYKDGILEVVVPKAAEERKVSRIPVAVGEERKALLTKGRKK
jgi:HSP20 family protein